jgi:hypothetical protein
MLRIQAESVGTGASGVKKQSYRQLLDTMRENNDKLCKRGLVTESQSDCSRQREAPKGTKADTFPPSECVRGGA